MRHRSDATTTATATATATGTAWRRHWAGSGRRRNNERPLRAAPGLLYRAHLRDRRNDAGRRAKLRLLRCGGDGDRRITAQLSRLVAALPAPFDPTPIVDSLSAVATAVSSRAPAVVNVDTTPIADALKPLTDAIASSPATDVSGIVAQLVKMVDQGDVDQTTIDALVAAGLLSASDGQTLQGIKWSDAISFIIGAAPVRAVEHAIKAIGADAATIDRKRPARSAPARPGLSKR